MANPTSQSLWSSRGIIVSVRGPGDSQVSIRLSQPFARIGSDRRAEVSLPEGDLLSCHIYLHATDNGIFCLGLADSAPSGWLTANTRVEIGPYRIKAAFSGDACLPAGDAGKLHKKMPLVGPAPVVQILDPSGQRRAAELPLDRPLTVIGRRAPSHIRLSHRTVSRVHCVLYWHQQRLWAIDLLSGNGTRLSEQSIDAALWPADEELSMGRFCMQYRELGGTSAAPCNSGRNNSLVDAAPNAGAPNASRAEPAEAHRDCEFAKAPSQKGASESGPANQTLSQLMLRMTQLQNELVSLATQDQSPALPSESRELVCVDAILGPHPPLGAKPDGQEPNSSSAPPGLPAPAEIAQLLLAAERHAQPDVAMCSAPGSGRPICCMRWRRSASKHFSDPIVQPPAGRRPNWRTRRVASCGKASNRLLRCNCSNRNCPSCV